MSALSSLLIVEVALMLYIRFPRPGTSKTRRHFVIASWSALSLMVFFTVLRVCRLYDAIDVDVVWIVLWHYLEAGIPIIILSIGAVQAAASVNELPKKEQEDIGIRRDVHARGDSTIIEEASDGSYLTEDSEPQSSGRSEISMTRAK